MNYKRSVILHCPTCGTTDFDSESQDAPEAPVKCMCCKRETSRQQLIDDNADYIERQKQELVHEATSKIHNDLHKALRNAFKGSKFIKVK
jgi:hypothetical protein